MSTLEQEYRDVLDAQEVIRSPEMAAAVSIAADSTRWNMGTPTADAQGQPVSIGFESAGGIKERGSSGEPAEQEEQGMLSKTGEAALRGAGLVPLSAGNFVMDTLQFGQRAVAEAIRPVVGDEIADTLRFDDMHEQWNDRFRQSLEFVRGEDQGIGYDLLRDSIPYLVTGISSAAKIAGTVVGRTPFMTGMSSGAIADFTMTNPEEGNIATIFRDMGMLPEYLEFMASDSYDEDLAGRLAAVIEGAIVGGAAGKMLDVGADMIRETDIGRAGKAVGHALQGAGRKALKFIREAHRAHLHRAEVEALTMMQSSNVEDVVSGIERLTRARIGLGQTIDDFVDDMVSRDYDMQFAAETYQAVHRDMYAPKPHLGKQAGMAGFYETPRISTRRPSTVNPPDYINEEMIIDVDAMKAKPAQWRKNVNNLRLVPGFRTKSRKADKVAEEFIRHAADNLLWLYDNAPDVVRVRGRKWYDGANKMSQELAEQHGVESYQVAGVMAALSPKKDWFTNIHLGKQVVEIMTEKQNTGWTEEMGQTASRIFGQPKHAEYIDRIRDKTFGELVDPYEQAYWIRIHAETHMDRGYTAYTPEGDQIEGVRGTAAWQSIEAIATAVRAMQTTHHSQMADVIGTGHKVRNFYNNIIDPTNELDVTIDTHAVAAATLNPYSAKDEVVDHNFGGTGAGGIAETGAQGTYGIYADAYRLAASERGVLPREMQSITWEAVRGLFEATAKGQQAKDEVAQIWYNYERGYITLSEARTQIYERYNGITIPEWAASGDSVPEGARPGADAGKPADDSVQRRGTGSRGTGSTRARAKKDSGEVTATGGDS